MGTAVEGTVRFNSMANDSALTMFASWCEHVDSALKGIKHMRGAVACYCNGFIISIPTDFTLLHITISRERSCDTEPRLLECEANLMPAFHQKKKAPSSSGGP